MKANSAPGIIVRANGGIGGNTINNNGNRCFGPGGGGAGGRILTNLFGIAAPTGGLAGVVIGSTGACNGTTSGAGNGDAGLADTLPAIPQGTVDYPHSRNSRRSACGHHLPRRNGDFIVLANDGGWDFQWQSNDSTGWQDITEGASSWFSK